MYEAEHLATGATVALKVLHGHLAEGDGARRFRREAQAITRVVNEFIVRVLDAGTCEATGHLYLVTERLLGEDLQTALDRLGPLSVQSALRIAVQALRGLEEAHAAQVVHRDIKPGNLFLARASDGGLVVKILDFGIAKIRAEPLELAQTTALTATGGLLGSPLYMSPEQVQNSRDVDPRTDLWSLACVLYAVLAGHAPHHHLSSIGSLLVAICVKPARPLREIAPWVPEEVAEVVHRGLSIDPASRYPTAAAMRIALSRFVLPGPLLEQDLSSSAERSAVTSISSFPPSSRAVVSPRVIVAYSDPKVRGDDATFHAEEQRSIGRSAVPKLAPATGRFVTVDARRLLGDQTELWTLSLDVHPNLSSLISRIWKAMRRAGSKLPPMTYGSAWTLFEPRTGRYLVDDPDERGERPTLEAAGIRPGTVLWVMKGDGSVRSAADT